MGENLAKQFKFKYPLPWENEHFENTRIVGNGKKLVPKIFFVIPHCIP